MTPDCELLRRYAGTGSDDAFAELVRRHLDLVFSAALRQVSGDAHLAQDVAQSVFTDLARKAAALSHRQILTGWLYTSTRFAAAKAARAERRRHAHEQEAHAMRELLHPPTADLDWEKLCPVLDQAMHELKETDREVILLRYFENRKLAAIGERLGLSEEAARKRVDRALEKLRALLSKRGISTAASVAAVLSANAVQMAPAGLAATLTSASLVSAGAGTGTTLTLLRLMATTKLKIGLTALGIVGATATVIIEHQSQTSLRQENEALRQQIAQLQADNDRLSSRMARARSIGPPRLPAPPVQAAAPAPAPPKEDLHSTNLYAWLKDKQPKLTSEQLGPYLKANHRNAASLLAGFRTSRDSALLEEAMQKYPDDSQVAFEAAFFAPPEQQRQWLDALKKSAPDNALSDYLSAAAYFKAGQTDQGVQDLIAAGSKPRFQDYTLERIQDDEEAFLSSGYSVAEAKAASSSQLLLPQLGQVKETALDVVNLAKSYQQAGDEVSAQAAFQMAVSLGQRYSTASAGEPEVSQLVGMAVERIALSAMDPTSPYGSAGQTVQDRLGQLAQERATLKELNQQFEPLQATLSDQDWINYKERWVMFGEEAALRWVIGKYGAAGQQEH